MRLRFRWPFYLGPKVPVKCLTCWDKGEYMVMRPGMMVPCDKCNAVRSRAIIAETTQFGPAPPTYPKP